jgi:RNA dependent RNA polymerase
LPCSFEDVEDEDEDESGGFGNIGRVTVTPTRLLFFPMEVETLNRVLRKYGDRSDRFLRINFAGENGSKIIYSSNKHVLPYFFQRYFLSIISR